MISEWPISNAVKNCLFWNGLKFFDLFDEVSFLVVELFVLLPVGVKLGQEFHKLVPVPDQDVQDRFRLVGVSNKHLKKKKSDCS